MKFYFAPLEGITRYIFRNAYEKYYGGIDKYFAPFISPTDNCFMTPKNVRELCPEHNQGIKLVPQILTNNSVAFIGAANELYDMGYKELNLILGCPSGTVCAKKKGAGFLTEWYEMEQLFDAIYEWAASNNVKISVKTRLGRFNPEEFYDILEIYNKYPISELIVHPRIEKDYYKGKPRMEFYEYAVEHSGNPIVYNGNLFGVEQIRDYELKYLAGREENELTEITEANSLLEKEKIMANYSFSVTDTVMLGRGLLYNPELIEQYGKIKKIDSKESKNIIINNVKVDSVQELQDFNLKRFWSFHDEIYHNYQEIMSPDKNVLFHMKELWTYWKELYTDDERAVKNILKSKNYGEYEALTGIIRQK